MMLLLMLMERFVHRHGRYGGDGVGVSHELPMMLKTSCEHAKEEELRLEYIVRYILVRYRRRLYR
jgi:hypothetical protein